MDGGVVVWLAAATREATMFAAVGLLIGGLDDLLVDCIYIVRRARRRVATPSLDQLPVAMERFAIFVAAWDEAAVIGAMLRSTLARLAGDFTIYIGTYPNDWATIEAVAIVGEHDRRVRLVIGSRGIM